MSVAKMVLAARILLGTFYLISGLNWFFGYLPLPSIHTPLDAHLKHQVVMEMIKTGWMFQVAKLIEIGTGTALLTNRLVPAMLALSAPVAFITFMLDAMILGDIWSWFRGTVSNAYLLAKIGDMIIGGLCILLIQVWLMLYYLPFYRPMLVWKTTSRAPDQQAIAQQSGLWHKVFIALGAVALALQAWNLYLFVGLISF